MKKLTAGKLVSLIAEAMLQEYYRDFESKVKKLGFDSVIDAAEKMVQVPEYVEWFGTDNINRIVNQELDVMDYIFNKHAREGTPLLVDPNEETEKEPSPKEVERSTRTPDSKPLLNLLDRIFDEWDDIFMNTKDEELEQAMSYIQNVAVANRKDIKEQIKSRLTERLNND